MGGLLAFLPAGANTFTEGNGCPGDTRHAVTSAGQPWRCIGRLSLPNHRFMTASLVGPDLVLTAAHGLVHQGKLKPGRFIFRPDFGQPHESGRDFANVTHAWLGNMTPDLEPDVHGDWAILQIDRPLGRVYGTLAVDDTDAGSLLRQRRSLCLVSYSRDFRHGFAPAWQAGGDFLALSPAGYLLHDFCTDSGASGGPIFHLDAWSLDAAAHIIALNVAEKTPQGKTLHGVPFAPRVANVAIAAHEFDPTLARLLAGDRTGGWAVPRP